MTADEAFQKLNPGLDSCEPRVAIVQYKRAWIARWEETEAIHGDARLQALDLVARLLDFLKLALMGAGVLAVVVLVVATWHPEEPMGDLLSGGSLTFLVWMTATMAVWTARLALIPERPLFPLERRRFGAMRSFATAYWLKHAGIDVGTEGHTSCIGE